MASSRNTKKEKLGDRLITMVIAALIVITVVVVAYPLWFVLIASFSDPSLVASGQVTLWPRGLTLAGYELVIADERIWQGYGNTILYAVGGTTLNLLVTLPAAFALSRRDFRPRRTLLFGLVFTMMFSGGLIPSYILFHNLGLLNTRWVFILPVAVNVFNLIIARAFFEVSIPEELYDAARVDGVSFFGFFTRIALPLSGALVAVIGLYYFVQHWNDYFTGLVFIRDQSMLPLQNVLQSIILANQSSNVREVATVGAGGTTMQDARELADQIKYGVIIVSSLPLLVLYPFVQKYFNKGVMLGAVKG
ncbi:carbohydrate ABC transporter membrane protein 2 (CUT1 family) [Promicromonospora sp. AC04]|uniref:carbohydrate ABC transporter permease n=1 Tax=Promicromonospora sp. AC04 TaxID=2135723 RepID=UPI000D348F7E|nr:carbohydrate ABC transporter permease [Promicromonospora sp. AC04]PUB27613.1 carbohydrate ABC transporter membrane protein 2 (CUT1 family) [Promicromonospora sp. AC04]